MYQHVKQSIQKIENARKVDDDSEPLHKSGGFRTTAQFKHTRINKFVFVI